MTKVLAAAALVLVAGTLTACGGPPDDASRTEFCGIFDAFYQDTQKLDEADTKGAVAALKRVADQLKDTGTPSNIPDDARAGFEKTLELIDALPDDATQDDLDNVEKDLSSAEQKNTDAFEKYLNEECPQPVPHVD